VTRRPTLLDELEQQIAKHPLPWPPALWGEHLIEQVGETLGIWPTDPDRLSAPEHP